MKSPLRRALEEALADGEWHTLGELVLLAVPYIPAEKAARVEMSRINARWRHSGQSGAAPVPDDVERLVLMGRAAIVGNCLYAPTFERETGGYLGFSRRYRLRWGEHKQEAGHV